MISLSLSLVKSTSQDVHARFLLAGDTHTNSVVVFEVSRVPPSTRASRVLVRFKITRLSSVIVSLRTRVLLSDKKKTTFSNQQYSEEQVCTRREEDNHRSRFCENSLTGQTDSRSESCTFLPSPLFSIELAASRAQPFFPISPLKSPILPIPDIVNRPSALYGPCPRGHGWKGWPVCWWG